MAIIRKTPETVTTLVDNGDGSLTYTSENGTVTTFDAATSTLTYDAGTHDLTFTDEDGVAQVINLDNPTLAYTPATNTLTHVAPDGTVTNIDLSDLDNTSVVTNLIAGNRIATHDDGNGTVVDIDETITTLTQNDLTGDITYTAEDGTTSTVDVVSTDANNDITAGADGGAFVDVTAEETTTVASYNATTHEITYTDEDGNNTVLDLDVGTIAYDPINHVITYTAEDGTVTNLTLDNPTIAYNPVTNSITHTAPDGTATVLDLSDLDNTSVVTNVIAGNRIATHDDGNGTLVDIDETITTLTDPGDGTYVYTSEDGTATTIDVCDDLAQCSIGDLGDVDTTGVNASDVLNWNGTTWVPTAPSQFGEYQAPFDASVGDFVAPAGLVTNNGDWFNVTTAGTVDGQAFDVGDLLIALVDNPSTTTFAGNWAIVEHPGQITSVVTNVIAGNRIATHDDGNGTVVDIDETVTTLVDNANGSFTYTSEDGTVTVFNAGVNAVTESDETGSDYTAGNQPASPPGAPTIGDIHKETYDNGGLISFFNGANWTVCFIPCDHGLPLPIVSSCVECIGGVLVMTDSSAASTNTMVINANAVTVTVTDGVTTAPAVMSSIGTTFNLDTTGLLVANMPWTITQTVDADICGETVQQTCTLDIDPC